MHNKHHVTLIYLMKYIFIFLFFFFNSVAFRNQRSVFQILHTMVGTPGGIFIVQQEIKFVTH